VVEGTAREASDRGYNVVVVGDCCASVSQEAHDSALTTALPFLATVTTLDEVTAALG
jgi:nicotinamidase-related amidase